jgi:hypothetical protein
MDYIINLKDNVETGIDKNESIYFENYFGTLLFDFISFDINGYMEILKKYNLILDNGQINRCIFVEEFKDFINDMNKELISKFDIPFFHVFLSKCKTYYKDFAAGWLNNDYNELIKKYHYSEYKRYQNNDIENSEIQDYNSGDFFISDRKNIKNIIDIKNDKDMNDIIEYINDETKSVYTIEDFIDTFDEIQIQRIKSVMKDIKEVHVMPETKEIELQKKIEKLCFINEYNTIYKKRKYYCYYSKIFIRRFYVELIELQKKAINLIDDYIHDEKSKDIEYLFFLVNNNYIKIGAEPTLPTDFKERLQILSEKNWDYKYINKLKERYLKENQNTLNPEYNDIELRDIIDISYYQIVKNKYQINKCENCGKYFIPFLRSDTLYCDRISPQDNNKTCKEYGSQEAYKRNLEENEAQGLSRKIYMQIQMAAKRNKNIPKYAQAFENFKVQSKQWKNDVKSGKKTEVEFIEWLNEMKRTGGINNGNDTEA